MDETILSQCFPLACCDGASEGFRHLSPALAAEVLKDDRLAAGEEGEVAVFWAAVSWLEAERSRRRNADEASWVRTPILFIQKCLLWLLWTIDRSMGMFCFCFVLSFSNFCVSKFMRMYVLYADGSLVGNALALCRRGLRIVPETV